MALVECQLMKPGGQANNLGNGNIKDDMSFTSLFRFFVQGRLCWRPAWTEKCGPTGRRFPYMSPSITTAKRQSNQLG
jgi:hypothetical protein